MAFIGLRSLPPEARGALRRKGSGPQVLPLELEAQAVRDEGDKLTIGGLSLGVGHCIAKEALEGLQIAPVPGHLDGMADGPLHPGGRGVKGLCTWG